MIAGPHTFQAGLLVGRSKELVGSLSQAQLDAFWCLSKGGEDLAGGLDVLAKIKSGGASTADILSRVTKARVSATASGRDLSLGEHSGALSEAFEGASGAQLSSRLDGVLGLSPADLDGIREAMASVAGRSAFATARRRVATSAAQGTARAATRFSSSLDRTANEAADPSASSARADPSATAGMEAQGPVPKSSLRGVRAPRRELSAMHRSKEASAAVRGQAMRARARTAMAGNALAPTTLRGWVSSMSTNAARAMAKGLAAAARSMIAPLLAVAAPVLVVGGLVFAVIMVAAAGSQAAGGNVADRWMQGLPPWVTKEMVYTAVDCMEKYGDPASANLAQMIQESGAGEEMSGLARDNKNLYGIKGDYDEPEVVGSSSWGTSENYGGQNVNINASFAVFKSHKDCIVFRSRYMLKHSPYSTNPTIQAAISGRDGRLMCAGLKDAGWATSDTYVADLNDLIDLYNLLRFDHVTTAQLAAGLSSGAGGPTVQAAIEAAKSQLGVSYDFKDVDAIPGVRFNCSGLTWWAYGQAGLEIPRGQGANNGWYADGSSGSQVYRAYASGRWVTDPSQLQPGDLMFWGPNGAHPGEAYRWTTHVGMYIGNGEMIHANYGGVEITSAWYSNANFVGGGPVAY